MGKAIVEISPASMMPVVPDLPLATMVPTVRLTFNAFSLIHAQYSDKGQRVAYLIQLICKEWSTAHWNKLYTTLCSHHSISAEIATLDHFFNTFHSRPSSEPSALCGKSLLVFPSIEELCAPFIRVMNTLSGLSTVCTSTYFLP